MESLDDKLSQLRHLLDTEANENVVQDRVLLALNEFRSAYGQAKSWFSPEIVQFLKQLPELVEAIHEFRDAQEDARAIRTKDEAVEILSKLEALRVSIWPPLLVRRIEKEIRELVEKAGALPRMSSIIQSASHKQAVMSLESNSPRCPRCGEKMTLRETLADAFWGCSTFPKCFSRRWLTKQQRQLLGIA